MRVESDVMDTPLIATVGVVATTVVFVLVLLLQVLFYRAEEGESARKRAEDGPSALRQLLTKGRLQLQEYRWIDKDRGVVSIPIDRAMDIVADEYSKGSR